MTLVCAESVPVDGDVIACEWSARAQGVTVVEDAGLVTAGGDVNGRGASMGTVLYPVLDGGG